MAKHMCRVGQKKGGTLWCKTFTVGGLSSSCFSAESADFGQMQKGGVKARNAVAESHNKIHSYSYTYSYKCNTDTATATIQTSPKNNSQSAQRGD